MFIEGSGETELTVYLGASNKVFNVADCSSELIKLVLYVLSMFVLLWWHSNGWLDRKLFLFPL